MITAIVPVKTLSEAKRRLAGALAPAVRERLVLTMMADVLATLGAAPSIGQVLVVPRLVVERVQAVPGGDPGGGEQGVAHGAGDVVLGVEVVAARVEQAALLPGGLHDGVGVA